MFSAALATSDFAEWANDEKGRLALTFLEVSWRQGAACMTARPTDPSRWPRSFQPCRHVPIACGGFEPTGLASCHSNVHLWFWTLTLWICVIFETTLIQLVKFREMGPGLYEIPHLEIPVSKRDLIILEAVQGLGKCAALIFFPKRGSVGNFPKFVHHKLSISATPQMRINFV